MYNIFILLVFFPSCAKAYRVMCYTRFAYLQNTVEKNKPAYYPTQVENNARKLLAIQT